MGFPTFSQQVDNVDDAEAADINPVYDAIENIVTATLFADYSNTEVLAVNKTLVDSDFPIQYLDPGGASRDVELPAEGSDNHVFFICNTADAAEDLVVKDDSPATIITIGQDEAGLLISDGTTWIGVLFAAAGGGLNNIVEDVTPQLGANLDVNDFDLEDANNNELIEFGKIASAINHPKIVNAAAGNPPEIQAAGGDTDIDLKLTGKGTGRILVEDGIYQGEDTLTDQATIAWDVHASPLANVTLGGDRTMAAPTNLKAGQFYSLRVIQDATGTRLLTWNAIFEWAGGIAPTLTTTANASDLLTFYCYDGTNLVGSLAVADHS